MLGFLRQPNLRATRGCVVKNSPVVNVYLPVVLMLIGLMMSVVADLTKPGMHWAQRFGAVMAVVGAYIVHYDDSIRTDPEQKLFSYRLKSLYTRYSLPCIVLGTLLWGYGDIIL